MIHEDVVKWLDQLETSLQRAEQGKKDIDLLILLRLAYKLMQEKERETR